MTHELAGALQQAGRIGQRCAVKEPHVYVPIDYVDVAERRVSEICNRTAIMQKLPDFIPAFAHHFKPLGIPLDSAVEPQQIRFHRCSTLCSRDPWLRSVFRRDLVLLGGTKAIVLSDGYY